MSLISLALIWVKSTSRRYGSSYSQTTWTWLCTSHNHMLLDLQLGTGGHNVLAKGNPDHNALGFSKIPRTCLKPKMEAYLKADIEIYCKGLSAKFFRELTKATGWIKNMKASSIPPWVLWTEIMVFELVAHYFLIFIWIIRGLLYFPVFNKYTPQIPI